MDEQIVLTSLLIQSYVCNHYHHNIHNYVKKPKTKKEQNVIQLFKSKVIYHYPQGHA